MKKVLKNTKGITLIALVVTIIVLLILAGVSINTLLGKNGILTSAKKAGDQMEMAVLRDRIEVVKTTWEMDYVLGNTDSADTFFEKLVEEGIIDDKNESVNITGSSTDADGTVTTTYDVDTVEDCTVEITVITAPDDITIIIGDIELSTSTEPKISKVELTAGTNSINVKATVRRLNDGKVTYSYREKGTTSWTTWTNTSGATEVTETEITISTGIVDGKTYEVKVYVKNSSGQAEKTEEIIIDTIVPQDATATFSATKVEPGTTITATVTLKDNESGVDLSKSKYEFNTNSSKIGEDKSSYTSTFSTLTSETGTISITLMEEGNWYLHILTVDKAGNKKETVIGTVIVEEEFNPLKYTWTQNKTTVTGTHKTSGKTVIYEVGEDYEYSVTGVSDGYTGTWKVLGAGEGNEAGKLLIMTASDVVSSLGLKGKTGDGTSSYPAGYNNGIAKLNEVCSEKCGTGARSINMDDINRVTGYDPENQGDGKVFGAENWAEYGNVVTYTLAGATAVKNGQTVLTSTNGLSNSVYYHPDGSQIGGSGGTQVTSITEKSTAYWYYPYSLTQSNAITGTCNGILTSSKAYEMIFGTYENTSSGKGNQYWLASTCAYTDSNYSCFFLHYVNSLGQTSYNIMWSSDASELFGSNTAVRAVVAL